MSKMSNLHILASDILDGCEDTAAVLGLAEQTTTVDLSEVGDRWYKLIMDGPCKSVSITLSREQLRKIVAVGEAFLLDYEIRREGL